jgi:hypothetical protein
MAKHLKKKNNLEKKFTTFPYNFYTFFWQVFFLVFFYTFKNIFLKNVSSINSKFSLEILPIDVTSQKNKGKKTPSLKAKFQSILSI